MPVPVPPDPGAEETCLSGGLSADQQGFISARKSSLGALFAGQLFTFEECVG